MCVSTIPRAGSGHIGFGGFEWMRAGAGVWHGKEISAGRSTRIKGFQLWIALAPELEHESVESQYVEARWVPTAGPAHVILGSYEGQRSPARSPEGITYLLVKLPAGTQWTFVPPEQQTLAWLSVAEGELQGDAASKAGDLLLFEKSMQPIAVQAASHADAVFVIGSAVGVLPKQIKPVEVREVLRSLHLLPGDAPPVPARRASDTPGMSSLESVNAPADWSDLHRWLQEMLADQNRALRADLETTVSRVLVERLPPAAGTAPAASRVPLWPAGALITTLAVVAATFVWLHLDSEAKWRAVTRQNMGLLSELNALRASDVVEASSAVARPDRPVAAGEDGSGEAGPAGLAAALEWSVNQGASYPPDALPFDDVRLGKLTGLLDRLGALDFRGTVRLEGHVGDFCMRRTADGSWAMAADDLPMSRCERIGLPPDEARTESGRQSVAFANYLAELGVTGGPIRVELEPLGNTRPLVAYPLVTDGMTAGEWNLVARQNHRVEVQLAAKPAAE